MAETVLFNIAEGILAKLGPLALQGIDLLWGLKDELESLRSTVSTIQAVLLDAEKQCSHNEEVKVWLERLKEVLYGTDDLLDEFSTEALLQNVISCNKLTKEVRLFFSSSNQFACAIKMARKIKDIRGKLDQIAKDKSFHLNEHLETTLMANPREQTHSSIPEVVIGREDEKKHIIELLLSDQGEAKVGVIPIVGLGGIGKTTLAQLVYNSEEVKTRFEVKLWVCVSDIFYARQIVEKMIESVIGGKPGKLAMETLKNQLHEKIRGKKFLLVLDDVWNEDRGRWLDLNDLMASGAARGSKIIITTRLMKVTEITSTDKTYKLEGLSESESWALFQKMAFREGKVSNSTFEMMGKKIVEKCAGSPLAIRTIGSLLYSKQEESEWKVFIDEEISNLDPQNNILQTLKVSYNHLPSNLKHCFAYCSLFPKDYVFHVPTLISLWKAQGFTYPSTRGRSSEDFGLSCFKNLLQRSFFQEINEHGDGVIRYCKMHDFMHDLAVSVSGKECIRVEYSNAKDVLLTNHGFRAKTRHISLDFLSSSQWQVPASLVQESKARTFLLLVEWWRKSVFSEEQCQAIICKMKCLRVLNLSSSGIKNVPSSIRDLKHLRHLDLSRNEGIKILPRSTTRLQNLEVLKLDFCRNLKQLPEDIKKLVNLSHLGVQGCVGFTHMPRGLGQFTFLEMIPRFVLAGIKHSGGLVELSSLNNLRGHLGIVNLRYVKNPASECKAANLKEKHALRSLELQWRDYDYGKGSEDDISNEEMALAGLEPHNNLKMIRVIGCRGESFPSWLSSLTNLVDIVISGCKNCRSLPSLSELPSLRYLKIKGLIKLEYLETTEVERGGRSTTSSNTSTTFFPSLKEFSLLNCTKLKGWLRRSRDVAGATAQPPSSSFGKVEVLQSQKQHRYKLVSLSKLEIRHCPDLTWMPLLPCLEDLTLEAVSTKLLEKISPTSLMAASVSQLRRLFIRDIGDLEFLSEELMKSLTSLNTLEVSRCPKIKTLSRGIRHLTSLLELKIHSCEKIDLSIHDVDGNDTHWQCLNNLSSLEISDCPKLKSLPTGLQHASSLQKLVTHQCPNLTSLPEWIANLHMLQILDIGNCPQLSKGAEATAARIGPRFLKSQISKSITSGSKAMDATCCE